MKVSLTWLLLGMSRKYQVCANPTHPHPHPRSSQVNSQHPIAELVSLEICNKKLQLLKQRMRPSKRQPTRTFPGRADTAGLSAVAVASTIFMLTCEFSHALVARCALPVPFLFYFCRCFFFPIFSLLCG